MQKDVKIIFCDGVDENNTLEDNSAKNLEEIRSKFLSPGTLQKNSVVEHGFATP